jgi:hypothetical protein
MAVVNILAATRMVVTNVCVKLDSNYVQTREHAKISTSVSAVIHVEMETHVPIQLGDMFVLVPSDIVCLTMEGHALMSTNVKMAYLAETATVSTQQDHLTVNAEWDTD